MFGRISRRYDLLNTVMTAGRHYAWRRMAARIAVGVYPGPALDIATGTGDFALELARGRNVTSVVGLDFTPEMLSLAAQKALRQGRGAKLSLVAGDAHSLPFSDSQFICATVGFGVRNFINVPKALREMARVVRPGGRVVILEIVRLEGRGFVSKAAPIYFRRVTTWLGALLAGNREAYTYLPESVDEFLSARELSALMEDAGLRNIQYHSLALGTVAIHVGEKPN
jgi:demethylmenaquinone methyltransferase/2-methoxy-6-polyprenyl-1,4-benzoquinol methylase